MRRQSALPGSSAGSRSHGWLSLRALPLHALPLRVLSQRVLPPRTRRLTLFTALHVVLLTALLGCGANQGISANGPVSGNAANAGGAAITAVAAGVIWAAGGGCRLQGCPYGSFCDQNSGFCEVRRCSQGCPPMTVCNEGLDRCQAGPPPTTPNDTLPQDNKILSPPTVH